MKISKEEKEVMAKLERKIFGFDDKAKAVMVRRDGLSYLASSINKIYEGRISKLKAENDSLKKTLSEISNGVSSLEGIKE